MLKTNQGIGVRRALGFEVESATGRGRPQSGWRGQVEKDKSESGVMGC